MCAQKDMETQRCRMAYPHDFPDYPCKICSPEAYKVWRERQDKRERFIAKALQVNHGMMDEDKLIKEAGEHFDKLNPIEEEQEECEYCGGINGEHHDISTMEAVYPGEPHMADIGSRPCPNSLNEDEYNGDE